MVVALFLRLDQALLHFLAVVAVKAVALDDGGLDALAAEYVLKGARDGGRSGAGRAGNGDDGVAFGHGIGLLE